MHSCEELFALGEAFYYRVYRASRSGRGKPSAHYAHWIFHFFSQPISRKQSFQANGLFIFKARVVLKPLVSLKGRLEACSGNIRVDRQTDKPTIVKIAAHARRGLISITNILKVTSSLAIIVT